MADRTYVDVAGLALPLVNDNDDRHEYPLDSITPHPHQQRLYEALTNETTGYYINGAPTGSGKTLSWLTPTVTEGRNAVAMYPTNALIDDQRRAIRELIKKDDALDPESLTLVTLTSETVDRLERRHDTTSRGAAIEHALRAARKEQVRRDGAVVVLTNPDLLVLIYRRMFAHRLEELISFDLFVVDEFHRAGRKERNTLRYTLESLLDDPTTAARQVVYLSATTENAFVDVLNQQSPYNVTAVESDPVAFVREVPADHRAIMPPVRLQLTPHETFALGRHMAENDRLKRAVREFVYDGRSTLILDGVREVEAVHNNLQATPPLVEEARGESKAHSDRPSGAGDESGSSDSARYQDTMAASSSRPEQRKAPDQQRTAPEIVRLDGFRRPDNLGAALERFDTLVSNSAVEVGIDFELERLLFSAANSDSFVQRLGRLRTAAEWHAAWGLVPETAYELDHGTGVVDALRSAARPVDEFLHSIDEAPVSRDGSESDSDADRWGDSQARLPSVGPPIEWFTPTAPVATNEAYNNGDPPREGAHSTEDGDDIQANSGNGTESNGNDQVPTPFGPNAIGEYLGIVSRPAFEAAIEAGYPNRPTAPPSFDWTFSAVEAISTLIDRAKNAPEDASERLKAAGAKRIKRHFYDPHQEAPTFDLQEQTRLVDRADEWLAEELATYRGDNVSVAVYHIDRDKVFTYRLPYVLRYGNVAFVPEEQFREHTQTSDEDRQTIERSCRYGDAYCLFYGTIPASADPRRPSYTPGDDGILTTAIQCSAAHRRPVQATVGVTIGTDDTAGRVEGLAHLNDCLADREFLCYVAPEAPSDLTATYPLPTFTFVYPFSTEGRYGSITFGHDALYLYAHTRD